MKISIYAPGIELKVTDINKINVTCDAIESIMSDIFFIDEQRHDVITIHNDTGDCITEISLGPNPNNGFIKGFVIKNEWYCMPEAREAILPIIEDLLTE